MNCFIFFVLLLNISFFSAEIFNSNSEIQRLFNTEKILAESLTKYRDKLIFRLSLIDEYLQEYNSLDSTRQELAENPIQVYKLLKRLVLDWKRIESEIESDKSKVWRVFNDLATESDLEGSAQALIRIANVYDLDVRQFAKGFIGDVTTTAKLSARDCLFLGKMCYRSQMLSRSLEWLETSWSLAGVENGSLSQNTVQGVLDEVAHDHDSRVLGGENSPQLFQIPVYIEGPFEQRDKISKNVSAFETEEEKYHALCRGLEFRNEKILSKLKCQMITRNDPYFRLAPIQMEEVHLDPKIVLFHNVISENEMKILREISIPHLSRSQVQGPSESESEISFIRTSQTGWLEDSIHPLIEKLSDRVSQYTGLSAKSRNEDAELLQIANYNNGAHYNAHHDYVLKDKAPDHMIYLEEKGLYIGDRIATWMIYLNSVTFGGRTAFPRIGASVEPISGSAVFWYNLLPSGHPDRSTLHGACPVLLESKWVSNKWIREGGQIFTRPCDLKI